ncbi:uncharacterized protein [Periplaneta americana]|uniref:uncharacterized protein isoform X3 n=1 Tax=Periplaneta americana TaxID=6978 RepID=UPI0037E7EE57
MEADAGKRKRGGNWTAEEKNILFSLIKPKISIIENKCLTTNANAMKEQAWKDVYNEFCVIFGNGDRSVPRLKEQWKRLKSSAKCNLLKFEHRNPTGGKYPPHLEFDINLLASLPQELTKGDAEFDSDAQVSYEVSEIPVTLLSPSSGEITSVEGISIPLSPTAVPSTAEVNSVSTNLDQCALTVPTVINKEQSSGSEGDCSSSERHGKRISDWIP